MPDNDVVVVEIPAGSRNKYEYHHDTDAMIHKDLEPGKRTSTRAWSGPEEAMATIEGARRRAEAPPAATEGPAATEERADIPRW